MIYDRAPQGEPYEKRSFGSLISTTLRRATTVACAFALACAVAFSLPLAGCSNGGGAEGASGGASTAGAEAGSLLLVQGFDLGTVPEYDGELAIELNGGAPYFGDAMASEGLETFSPLDDLGRCGTAVAVVGEETMPTEERGSIQEVHPSGWHSVEYDWVDGGSLYNRSHLIGYQLTGQNANELNLITGTRSMNAQGMLPYEESIADYVRSTGNHVLYRVTPVFEGDNLIASGVLMEARSVEDAGWGLEFCVWCYNVEPGVAIDYATGDSWPDGGANAAAGAGGSGEGEGETAAGEPADRGPRAPRAGEAEATADSSQHAYVLNTSSHRLHVPSCPSVADMKESNKKLFDGTRDEAIALGYEPCGTCEP